LKCQVKELIEEVMQQRAKLEDLLMERRIAEE
jgi:hypothetical protein